MGGFGTDVLVFGRLAVKVGLGSMWRWGFDVYGVAGFGLSILNWQARGHVEKVLFLMCRCDLSTHSPVRLFPSSSRLPLYVSASGRHAVSKVRESGEVCLFFERTSCWREEILWLYALLR